MPKPKQQKSFAVLPLASAEKKNPANRDCLPRRHQQVSSESKKRGALRCTTKPVRVHGAAMYAAILAQWKDISVALWWAISHLLFVSRQAIATGKHHPPGALGYCFGTFSFSHKKVIKSTKFETAKRKRLFVVIFLRRQQLRVYGCYHPASIHYYSKKTFNYKIYVYK